jgi:hypothetical protein
MWTSADGLGWTSTGLPDGISDVCALTSMAGGFLAFGRDGDRIAAWTSADGARWVESEVELSEGSDITAGVSFPVACRVVAVDSGLVAVVLVANDTLMWTSLIWTSRDGVSWDFQEILDVSGRPIGAFGNRVPLAAVGGRVLLATFRGDPADPDGSRQVLLVGVVEP